MMIISPYNFDDYKLIDSGGYEKLEQFGKYILARPEPQAVWDKTLSNEEWNRISQATFKKDKLSQPNDDHGKWILKNGMPEQWFIQYNYKDLKIKMRLGLTAFKHVGIFPEQSENWNYIYDTIQSINDENVNILNLFAYTGGASLAAKAAKADVTHVDSVRQVISWSKENMEASRLDNIRWVVEDALKFVSREARRGNVYNGIVLDPPAYGRGPAGEKWILEDQINELLKRCNQILKSQNSFLVINLYSMGFSALILENLIASVFGNPEHTEYGELFVPDQAGRKLPLGIFLRFKRC
jgi:23S rRNA (cytosine1962-C5)-methyltransferase